MLRILHQSQKFRSKWCFNQNYLQITITKCIKQYSLHLINMCIKKSTEKRDTYLDIIQLHPLFVHISSTIHQKISNLIVNLRLEYTTHFMVESKPKP